MGTPPSTQMLRTWCRIRPVANLAVFHAASRNDVGRAVGSRSLSAKAAVGKSKEVRASILKKKAEVAAMKAAAEATAKAKRKAKAAGDSDGKTMTENDSQGDGSMESPAAAAKAEAQISAGAGTSSSSSPIERPSPTRGAGVWTSLEARLRNVKKTRAVDDGLRIIQGESEPAFFMPKHANLFEALMEEADLGGPAAAEEATAAAAATEIQLEKEQEDGKKKGRSIARERKLARKVKSEEMKAAKAARLAAKAEKSARRKQESPESPEEKQKKKEVKKEAKKRKKSEAPRIEVKTIKPGNLRLQPVEEGAVLNVPRLSYNLDRALFNPGVYQIQDPRSRVFNFDPYLTSIMPVDEFDFDALKQYVTSSKDVKLRELSAAHDMKYCGSTSSMTAMLSHFHFLLSAWRMPNLSTLSRSLVPESFNFTNLTRGPAAAFAHYEDGVYAIDADKQYDTENILSSLGKSMEKLLTLPKEDYEKYRRTRSHQLTEEEKNAEESFHYTTMGDFMMRSQLDAHDPRLPGTGMFDLKTRAVVSIRMDVKGYEKGVGYEIRERFGQWESFEREYYDLIRSAFLKYSLQVRMGRMDGIFVAFHNTRRIFGFQYISLAEMDHALHGTSDTRLGDMEFKASVAILNEVLNKASERYPGRSLRLHVETRPTKVPLTYFFIEPVSDEEMQEAQEAGKSSAEQLERDILSMQEEEEEKGREFQLESSQPDENSGIEQAEESESQTEQSSVKDGRREGEDENTEAAGTEQNEGGADAAWESMMAKVEETVENESLGIGSVREAVQDALEHSGLLANKSELETEQCLDAMVASLTAHSDKIRNLRETSMDGEEDDDSLQLERETDDQSSYPQEDVNSLGGEAETDLSAAEERHSRGTSLKDLILRATKDISEKPNPTTFQQMFADLATQSRQTATAAEGEEEEIEEDVVEDENEDVDVETLQAEEQQLSGSKASDEVREDGDDGDAAASGAEEAVEEEDDGGSNEEAITKDDNAEEEDDVLFDLKSEGDGEGEGEGEGELGSEGEAAEVLEGAAKDSREPQKQRELMGLYITIRNKVNGKPVPRPNGDDKELDWSVEYAITELPAERAQRIYADLKKRRRTVLSRDAPSNWHAMFKGYLPLMTKRGQRFREERTLEEANRPTFVAWEEQPIANGDGIGPVDESGLGDEPGPDDESGTGEESGPGDEPGPDDSDQDADGAAEEGTQPVTETEESSKRE